MVSVLHPLSPADQALLADFLSLRADLDALARKHSRPLPAMIAWAASPHIAHYLHAYLDITAISEQLKGADRKAATLSRIEALSPDDPTEHRRIAQSILRALPPPRARPSAARERQEDNLALPQSPRAHEAPVAPERAAAHDEQHLSPREPSRAEPPPARTNSPSTQSTNREAAAAILEELLKNGPTIAPKPIGPLRPPRRMNTLRSVESLLAAAGASG